MKQEVRLAQGEAHLFCRVETWSGTWRKNAPSGTQREGSVCSPVTWLSSPALTWQQRVCSEVLALRPKVRAARQRHFPQGLGRSTSRLVSRSQAARPSLAARVPAHGCRDLSGFMEVVDLTLRKASILERPHTGTIHQPMNSLLQPAIIKHPFCVQPSARHWGTKWLEALTKQFFLSKPISF